MEAINESNRLNKVAEFTSAYRPKLKVNQMPKVTCSRQVYELLLDFGIKIPRIYKAV